MVVRPRMSWLHTIFTFKSTTLRDTFPRIAAATLFAVIVSVVEMRYNLEAYSLTPTPFALTGVAIGIFLGFRNNTAYSRFWEARTLWGGLINQCRSMARQVATLVDGPPEFQRALCYRVIGFAHALRHQLRDTPPWDQLGKWLPPEELERIRGQRNVPAAILTLIGLQLREARVQGWLHVMHVPVVESTLADLTNIQGGSERIKNTPVPYPYRVLSHRVVAFYCLFLPLGLFQSTGMFTPLVVAIVAHAFYGLDAMGEEIEEPFSREQHCVPLEALCRTIEVNLRQGLGEQEVPEMLQPVDGVLL